MAQKPKGPAMLRAWRGKERRRSLRAVGEALGISGETIRNFETGKSRPDEREAKWIAALTGLSDLANLDAWVPAGARRTQKRSEAEVERRIAKARVVMGVEERA